MPLVRKKGTLEESSWDEALNFVASKFKEAAITYAKAEKVCILEADRGTVPSGEIPPDIMFPMVRTFHVMDSCVNCGQCQDACSMELPLSRLIFMLNRELTDVFKCEPGMDVNAPITLKSVTNKELAMAGIDIQF
jgi:predicted molibdopterin-dependent oxidoreductase YjgC